MKHAAGCHTYTTHPFYIWLEKHKIFASITSIVLGAVVATVGKRMFPWIGAIIAAVSMLFTVFSVSSALGWSNEILGVMLTFLVGAALAIATGSIIRRNIGLAIIVTAILGGLTAGNAIYDLLLTSFGWESLIGWAVLVSLFGLIGGALTFKFGSEIILFGTSLIGSYFFVRGWSLIFGGWPSETVIFVSLRSEEHLDVTWSFYIYFVLTLVLFGLTSWWQHKKEPHHDEVEEAIKSNDFFLRSVC